MGESFLKKFIIAVGIFLIAGLIIEFGVGNYFYNYAVSNHPKTFIAKSKPLQKRDPNYADLNWFQHKVNKKV